MICRHQSCSSFVASFFFCSVLKPSPVIHVESCIGTLTVRSSAASKFCTIDLYLPASSSLPPSLFFIIKKSTEQKDTRLYTEQPEITGNGPWQSSKWTTVCITPDEWATVCNKYSKMEQRLVGQIYPLFLVAETKWVLWEDKTEK